MMQPPSSLPNFSLPPPGFSPFSSSDSGPSTGGSQTTSDANQELWVETKAGDGKVPYLLFTVIIPVCVSKHASMSICKQEIIKSNSIIIIVSYSDYNKKKIACHFSV